jgi:hypothetical protein
VDTLVTRPILSVPRGFDPPVVEKVERLLEMLDAIANNPYLKSRLILHGGTALNVFHADMRGVLTAADPAVFDDMRARVAAYLSPLSILTPAEAEYMELLGTTGQHAPELLFGGRPDIAERARISPVVAWKVQNLRSMLGRREGPDNSGAGKRRGLA